MPVFQEEACGTPSSSGGGRTCSVVVICPPCSHPIGEERERRRWAQGYHSLRITVIHTVIVKISYHFTRETGFAQRTRIAFPLGRHLHAASSEQESSTQQSLKGTVEAVAKVFLLLIRVISVMVVPQLGLVEENLLARPIPNPCSICTTLQVDIAYTQPGESQPA